MHSYLENIGGAISTPTPLGARPLHLCEQNLPLGFNVRLWWLNVKAGLQLERIRYPKTVTANVNGMEVSLILAA
jgi:hypothetical protein